MSSSCQARLPLARDNWQYGARYFPRVLRPRVMSPIVKVFGSRPTMTGPDAPGPASENLQGRKPREMELSGFACAMAI